MTALAGWENFYVIVGSSAGALIGLQFVVITLIADIPGNTDFRCKRAMKRQCAEIAPNHDLRCT